MSVCSFWKKVISLDTTLPSSEALSFLSAQGKVIESIEPGATGRVQLQGVSWLACCAETLQYPLPVETPVKIIGRSGLVLLIEPVLPLPVVSFSVPETYSPCCLTLVKGSNSREMTAA